MADRPSTNTKVNLNRIDSDYNLHLAILNLIRLQKTPIPMSINRVIRLINTLGISPHRHVMPA